jgi:hypothetical protein
MLHALTVRIPVPARTACCSWHTYRLLVYMHEVPDLDSKTGGIRRLDRYDQLAEYVFGESTVGTSCRIQTFKPAAQASKAIAVHARYNLYLSWQLALPHSHNWSGICPRGMLRSMGLVL